MGASRSSMTPGLKNRFTERFHLVRLLTENIRRGATVPKTHRSFWASQLVASYCWDSPLKHRLKLSSRDYKDFFYDGLEMHKNAILSTESSFSDPLERAVYRTTSNLPCENYLFINRSLASFRIRKCLEKIVRVVESILCLVTAWGHTYTYHRICWMPAGTAEKYHSGWTLVLGSNK